METIVIEAVSDKFKNKYNNGSVLAGGKWMQVSSKVPLSAFQKDTEVSVELKTNDKGYTSIVGIAPAAVEVAAVEAAIVKARTKKDTAPAPAKERAERSTYEEDKNRRILAQGAIQAAGQNTALMALDLKNVDEIATATEELALRYIAFVEEQVK
jgi:hypothetical protein